MDSADSLTLLEQSRVSPAPGAVSDQIIQLSFLDIPWTAFYPIHQLNFYHYPHPKSHFTQKLIPKLKHSLSLTLQHFFPYAGKMVVFPHDTNSNTRKIPEIHYADGDSVSLVVAESPDNFEDLTGNHARKADRFYPLVPRLGEIVHTYDYVKVPLFAAQVTLFPGHGISIGLTTHHIACDGNARVRFLKSWASITKSGDDNEFLSTESPLVFDRTILKDPKGLKDMFWGKLMKMNLGCQPQHLSSPTDKVRVTLTVTRTQINVLKALVSAKRPSSTYASSFVIICALVWSSLAKLHEATMEEKDLTEIKYETLVIPADGRARLDPPVPATYFGNCLVGTMVTAKREELASQEGFLNGVELIRDDLRKMFKSQESIFGDADEWQKEKPLAKVHGIAGSPKFNVYDTDFGFGKPRKCEAVSIDYGGSVSLSVSRDCEDDMEIGLSLSAKEIDIFVAIFE